MKHGQVTTVSCGLRKKAFFGSDVKLCLLIALLPLLLVNGCAGFVGTKQPPNFKISPLSLNFGKVAAGQKSSQTFTLTNTGKANLTIQKVTFSSPQFGISGATFPMTLSAGQSTNFSVWFTGTASGNVTGTLTIQGASGTTPAVANLSGTITSSSQPQISVTPMSLDLGTVSVGSKGSSNLVIANNGAADLTVSMITLNGTEFAITGIATPKTISSGQSVPVTVTFTPTAAGAVSGSITFTSNDPMNPTTTVSLTGTGSTTPVGQLTANPTSLSFASLSVGSNASQTIALKNSGTAKIQVKSISTVGSNFSISGATAPFTLDASQVAMLNVKFTPTAVGNASGSMSVVSDASASPLNISFSGTGTQSGLSISPASFNFGTVVDGQTKSQNFVLTNTGSAALTVTQVSVTGAGYSASGLNTPTTIDAGKTVTFSVLFAPATAGSLAGNVSISSDAPTSPNVATLSGTGQAASVTLSSSPSSLSFGNVNAGSANTKSVTITNSGNSSVTLSQITVAAKDVSANGISIPMTLAPGQHASMNLIFDPSASETVTGNVTVSTTQGTSAVIPVTGNGIQAALSLTPSSVSFGNVTVGSPNSQTIQISNSGTALLTISQLSVTGSGFSTSSVGLPLSLNPGSSSTFNVQFVPQSAGNVSGGVSLVSNAPSSPATVPLTGTGVAATAAVSLSSSSLSFGNVNTGSSAQQSVTITNTGNASVTISQINLSGSGYTLSGAGTPVTLSPTQTLTFTVQFSPSATGTASGSVSVVSNAAGSPASIALSGTGVAPQSHSVALSWNASTSTVSGYNVYRSTTSGSGYSKLNAALIGGLNYTDSSVQNGQTYYYVTTAVDGSGNESSYSNQAQAIIP